MHILDHIFDSCDPDALAVVSRNQSLTYRELETKVTTLAETLRNTPAFQSDTLPRIALHCPNGVSYIVYALAILRAGACFVPVPSELALPEQERLIHSTACHGIIAVQAEKLHHLGTEKTDLPAHLAGLPGTLLTRPQEKILPTFPVAEFDALNPAFIRFSSGTTGNSKGIVLSHEALPERITAANKGLQITPEDNILWILPMAHHFAVSIILYLAHGATTIVENSHLAGDVLEVAEKHQATIIYGAPFHYTMLGGDTSDFTWPTLRLAVSTAAPLNEHVATAFHQRFQKPLHQGLGIIEVGLSILNLNAPIDHPKSIGQALPDFTITLLDDQGQTVPLNEPGELHIQGPGLLDAYLAPWQTRDEALTPHGFASGDLATIDQAGNLTLVGRKKSVINVAGLKVFPEEVELFLNSQADISLSRVYAKDHPTMGQVPVADLVPTDPASPPKTAPLSKRCRQSLAGYKVPMLFNIVDSIPRTASGKIIR